jgi:hypothetical protein
VDVLEGEIISMHPDMRREERGNRINAKYFMTIV